VGFGVVSELQPEDPRLIGPYRLLGQLGAGGMGRVFLGMSTGGRPVAVKVIRAELAADPEFRTRFSREVTAARRVNGRFIVSVMDADVDAQVPWLATAYVAGPSLAETVRDHGPLSAKSLMTVAAGVAEGLNAIHAAGMVHGDLKPSNVLLAEDGPRVTDFGISHAAPLTHPNLAMGSPGFMSPEQALGQKVRPPSDVFSLGAVLAFAATGERPFGTGTPFVLLDRVIHGSPDLDKVPTEVRPLVERCLAKDPRERPSVASLLAPMGAMHFAAGSLPESVVRMTPMEVPSNDDDQTPIANAGGTLTVTPAGMEHGVGPVEGPGQMQRPAGPLVSGYAADTIAGQDELGIAADVDSLCSLLMASLVEPPLSVGLFGDWGSGKSFFMQRMRVQIEWIASESRACRDQGSPSDFCESVRQITFNAWHYVDANLWASLVTRIFDGLLGDTDDQMEPPTLGQREDQERRRRRLLTQLESAELMAGEVRRQRSVAERRLTEKLQERAERGSKLDRLTALRAADVAAVAQRNPEEVANALDTVPEPLRADIEFLGQAHGIWRQLAKTWSKLGTAARWQTAGLVLASAALVVGGILLIHSSAAKAVVPLIVAAISLLAITARWLPQLKRIRQYAALAAQAVDQAVSRQQAILDAEIVTATADIDAARLQLAAADMEIAEIQSGHRIRDFIAARAGSSDYQRNLGLISVVRRDLARLSRLVSHPSHDSEAIDRVVLYIDDLDRCPAERVAEVLQAVHLLLAFPLFIVVVGADVQWLLRSLELHYAELIATERAPEVEQDPELALHWSATPQNYLDKIFQIPFSLRPMGPAGFDRLIRSTADAANPAARTSSIADEQTMDAEILDNQIAAAADTPLQGPAFGRAKPPADPDVAISLADLPKAMEVSGASVSGHFRAAAFIGAGHRLALLGTHGPGGTPIATMDARTGKQTGGWTTNGVSVLSPDGSLVAVISGPEVQLREADSGRTIRVLHGKFSSVHFSADSSWLTAIHPAGLTTFELVGQARWERDLALPTDLRWLGVLPGGSRAIQVCSYTISTIELGSGSVSTSFEGAAQVFACSPNGDVLVTADSNVMRIFDIPTGQRRHLLCLGGIQALAVSADQSMIAAAYRERQGDTPAPLAPFASIVVIKTATGRPIMKVQSTDIAFDQLAFSANCRSLAAGGVASSRVRVWSLATTDTNLRSQRLELTEPELAFLGQLWPLVRTPRATKRLINLYRLLRTPLNPVKLSELLGGADAEPEYPAVLLLLTIVTGFPDLAQSVIEGLLQTPGDTWAGFIGKHRRSSEQAGTSDLLWKVFFERYDQVDPTPLPEQIDSYVRWAPLVARYSFRTGQMLG
jgi:Protein kinase domain/KAP family P-loop domain